MRSRVIYVALIAAVMTVGLVGFAQAGPEPIAKVPRFAGVWVDQTLGMMTAFYPEGIFTMISTTAENADPLAGNWGSVRGRFVLRTIVGRQSQIWAPDWTAAQKNELINGGYDLTAVADVGMKGANLVGSLRTWHVTFGDDGKVQSFKAWDDPDSAPLAMTWEPVFRVYPMAPQIGADIPTGLQKYLADLVVGGSTTGGGHVRDALPVDDYAGGNSAQ